MGIYLINRDTLAKLLDEYYPMANDLGSEVIEGAISKGMKVKHNISSSLSCLIFSTCLIQYVTSVLSKGQVQTYLFDGYWENMSSIEAFYKANMDSIKKSDIRYK